MLLKVVVSSFVSWLCQVFGRVTVKTIYYIVFIRLRWTGSTHTNHANVFIYFIFFIIGHNRLIDVWFFYFGRVHSQKKNVIITIATLNMSLFELTYYDKFSIYIFYSKSLMNLKDWKCAFDLQYKLHKIIIIFWGLNDIAHPLL